MRKGIEGRVAEWKMPIWVIFSEYCYGTCWYMLWSFGLFYSYLCGRYLYIHKYCMYGYLVLFHLLVCCIEKNMATLIEEGTSIYSTFDPRPWTSREQMTGGSKGQPYITPWTPDTAQECQGKKKHPGGWFMHRFQIQNLQFCELAWVVCIT
jgi:hypothetical protein